MVGRLDGVYLAAAEWHLPTRIVELPPSSSYNWSSLVCCSSLSLRKFWTFQI